MTKIETLNICNIDFKISIDKTDENTNLFYYAPILTNKLKCDIHNKLHLNFNGDILNDNEFDKLTLLKVSANELFNLTILLSQFSKNRFNIILNMLIYIIDCCRYRVEEIPINVLNNNLFLIRISRSYDNSKIGFYGDCSFNVFIFILYNTLRHTYKYYASDNLCLSNSKILKIYDFYNEFDKYFKYSGDSIMNLECVKDYIFNEDNRLKISNQLLKDKLHFLNCLINSKNSKTLEYYMNHVLCSCFATDDYECLIKPASNYNHAIVYIRNGTFEILYDLNNCTVIPVLTKLKLGYIEIYNLYPSQFDDVFKFIIKNNYLDMFNKSYITHNLHKLVIEITYKFKHNVYKLYDDCLYNSAKYNLNYNDLNINFNLYEFDKHIHEYRYYNYNQAVYASVNSVKFNL